MRKSTFIVGPTASGKSALALALASQLDAEIASVDAFQIYRQLNIGTGKPTCDQRSLVPHHLLDIAAPLENFSVADYLKYAEQVEGDATRRNKNLLWVGGTGLYVRALHKGLTNAPPSDESVVNELSQKTTDELAAEISKVDPEWAAKADLRNPRRTIRALAIYLQTGKLLSQWQAESTKPIIQDPTIIFLQPDIDDLRHVISHRVKKMWHEGWVDEVISLRKIIGWQTSQSASAIGYRTICEYLDGKLSREECLESIILETGQYAKRQLTWFRSEDRTIPIKIKAKDFYFSTQELLSKLQEVFSPLSSSQ